jgi:hypothetical protein
VIPSLAGLNVEATQVAEAARLEAKDNSNNNIKEARSIQPLQAEGGGGEKKQHQHNIPGTTKSSIAMNPAKAEAASEPATAGVLKKEDGEKTEVIAASEEPLIVDGQGKKVEVTAASAAAVNEITDKALKITVPVVRNETTSV